MTLPAGNVTAKRLEPDSPRASIPYTLGRNIDVTPIRANGCNRVFLQMTRDALPSGFSLSLTTDQARELAIGLEASVRVLEAQAIMEIASQHQFGGAV